MLLGRSATRTVVWVALYAFLSSAGLPLYESHALDADDAACLTPGGLPGGTTTVGPLEASDQPAHCAVCHLLRAVNGTITPAIAALAVPASTCSDVGLTADIAIAAEHSAGSSRAPPLQS